jgi:small multidrug resistance pump
MSNWLLLAGAITAEVCGTLALRGASGFSRLVPSILVILGYAIAFFLLSLVLKGGMPLSTAYAVWSSVGIAVVAVASWMIFGEVLSAKAILGMALITAGVVLVQSA